jgi:hypothetical protein
MDEIQLKSVHRSVIDTLAGAAVPRTLQRDRLACPIKIGHLAILSLPILNCPYILLSLFTIKAYPANWLLLQK